MEQSPPLDISDDIVSFGPSFGGEAADEFVKRLTAAGLEYLDDFFVLMVIFLIGVGSMYV
jgi:hypothetical protein